MELGNITSEDGKGVKTSCDRCAGCCTGGGPVLRQADAHLIRSGRIPSKYLYTIRKGEFLFNKDQMKLIPAETDLIKIKINKETFECLFMEADSHCSIYGTRPIECRAFKCWDTKEIEDKYGEKPLERADILSDVEGLWDLIIDHQERCSYAKMKTLTEKLEADEDGTILSEINEIINYDNALRVTIVEKAKVDPEMLHFLIGRPFIETMAMFNFTIEENDGGYVLKPVE
jgi:Fe-S-cluster containining protein